MATTTVSTLTAVLQMDNSKFKKGISQSQRLLKDFASTMGVAFSVGALVAFGREAVNVAAKLEGISAAFAKFPNHTRLLENLRKATRGTVDDLTLMKYAVQAKNFKIPLDQLAKYFEFATTRAIQSGEAVDYLVESIVTGVGRKSSRVLDNLGISLAELQDEVRKVGDFGIAAGNIIERELTNMGDVADTTATKIGRISAAWKNLQAEAGKGINWLAQAAQNDIDKFSYWYMKGRQPTIDEINRVARFYTKTGFMNQSEWSTGFTSMNRGAMVKPTSVFPSFNAGFAGGGISGDWQYKMSQSINDMKTALPQVAKITGQIKDDFGDLIDLDTMWADDETWIENLRRRRQEYQYLLDIAKSYNGELEDTNKKAKELQATISYALVSSFKDLGNAISMSLQGAENAFEKLGETIAQNIGNILIMIGVKEGLWWLAAIGAVIQIGAGIIGSTKNSVNSSYLDDKGGYSRNIQFSVSGRDLKAVLDRNSDYNSFA